MIKTLSIKRVIARHHFAPVNEETDLALRKGEEVEIVDCSGVWWMARNRYGDLGLIPFNYVEEIRQTGPVPGATKGLTDIDRLAPVVESYDRGPLPLPAAVVTSGSSILPLPPALAASLSTATGGSGCFWLEPSNFTLKHSWYFPNVDRETAEAVLRASHQDGSFLIRPSTTENRCFTLSLLYKSEKFIEVKHYLIQQCPNSGYFYMRPNERFPSLDKLIKHYRSNRGHLITNLSTVPSRLNTLDQMFSEPAKPLSGIITKDKSWEIKASELQLLEELGSGQFGVVRHGKWMGKIDVAVKLMKEGTMSEHDFIEEAKVMTKLQHNNLVKLYGLCIEHRPICIVAEFMKHGSLLSFLRKNEAKLGEQSTKVTYILLNMCIQVCSGMAYLESHNYIHRDLAARNCLVGNSGIVKVADFGLTRYVIDDEYTSSGGTKFPIRWAPPEVLWYTRFSSKSDVWAYGILMWEIFTCGKLPYGKMSNSEVVERIREGHRLDRPKPNCSSEIYQLMQLCWQELPEKRPSFGKIEFFLGSLKSREIARRH